MSDETNPVTYSAYQEYKSESVMAKPNSKLTPSAITGPYYFPSVPFRTTLTDGPSISVTGTVKLENGEVPQHCFIEFWQADASGVYDIDGPKFRGIQKLGDDGSYELHTVEPGHYDISEPTDPQPHEYRCPHLHCRVWIKGVTVLITQLYFKGDKYNASDNWFDERLLLKERDSKTEGVWFTHSFDFIVAPK